MADPILLAELLKNLVSNAIAYAGQGAIVTVRVLRTAAGTVLEVEDNGPGIEPQHLSRLFERFYRVEKSRNRNEGGSGLGLAIVKHIIETHGQQIQVTSNVGVGTTFTFSLQKSKASGPVSSRGIPLK